MAVIGSQATFLDVRHWYARLSILERQICRIELNSVDGETYYSTGFLIGPDLVITSYHSIKPPISPRSQSANKKDEYSSSTDFEHIRPKRAVARFDYILSAVGKDVEQGIEYELVENNWLVDFSNFSLPTQEKGHEAELSDLDYVILRFQGDPGLDNINSADSPRGWIELINYPEEIRPKSAVSILQHPRGQPLRISMDTSGIIGYNSNKSRVLYTADTEAGSSGAPCFDIN